MNVRESENGDYIISQTPVFHWVIILLLMGLNFQVHWIEAPLILKIFMGVILGLGLIQNTNFTISTIFSSREQKIRSRHIGLFGVRRRTVGFGEVVKCDYEALAWGRRNTYSRATLTLETYNDTFPVFFSVSLAEGRPVSERIVDLIAPSPVPEVPDTAVAPTWFDDSSSNRLADVCQRHSSESCSFEELSALNESRQSEMKSRLPLPKDERVLAFLDTTLSKSGGRGVAVACGGLYWRNPMWCCSRRCWVGWEELMDTAVAKDPADEDVWISPGMQIGLIDKNEQEGVYELLLALQAELKAMRAP